MAKRDKVGAPTTDVSLPYIRPANQREEDACLRPPPRVIALPSSVEEMSSLTNQVPDGVFESLQMAASPDLDPTSVPGTSTPQQQTTPPLSPTAELLVGSSEQARRTFAQVPSVQSLDSHQIQTCLRDAELKLRKRVHTEPHPGSAEPGSSGGPAVIFELEGEAIPPEATGPGNGAVARPAVVTRRPIFMPAYQSSKHLQTEQLMTKHSLKAKLQKYVGYVDRASALLLTADPEAVADGLNTICKVLGKAWLTPRIGHDLAYRLCAAMRDSGAFDRLLQVFLDRSSFADQVRLAAGNALVECLPSPNRDHVIKAGLLPELISSSSQMAHAFKTDGALMGLSLMQNLFKHSVETTQHMLALGALDKILYCCSGSVESPLVMRHAALALANLAMYGDWECRKLMIQKKVADWLFILASRVDDVTRYYACLTVCLLASNKEMEAAVAKSGTLALVEPFLLAHRPADFATADQKHAQGRPAAWLRRLLPLLNASRREARCLAAYHFAMDASIKRQQDRADVFHEIGAVSALKELASCPDDVASKFASQALELIGETLPYKLSQQVPLWSVEDVTYWVRKIGFQKYASNFADQMVDGDLLLLLTEEQLEQDLCMTSSILRQRFLRELESLKINADYSCIDESQLDAFIMSVNPDYSVYTYRMLEMGVDAGLLPSLADDVLRDVCKITNPIHRLRLRQALQDYNHIDDLEISLLSKQIDVFISYRRSTGSQLASLIKVLLQLRGYKVFIDVDRLAAGKFDNSLFKNIRAAKHFVLVLTPHSLDRLLGDDDRNDWVHKEICCAFEHKRNMVPIFDPEFRFPEPSKIPIDVRSLTKFNGVRWIHEYQDACVDKLERFIRGEDSCCEKRLPLTAASSRVFSRTNLLPNNTPPASSSPTLPQSELSDFGAY